MSSSDNHTTFETSPAARCDVIPTDFGVVLSMHYTRAMSEGPGVEEFALMRDLFDAIDVELALEHWGDS